MFNKTQVHLEHAKKEKCGTSKKKDGTEEFPTGSSKALAVQVQTNRKRTTMMNNSNNDSIEADNVITLSSTSVQAVENSNNLITSMTSVINTEKKNYQKSLSHMKNHPSFQKNFICDDSVSIKSQSSKANFIELTSNSKRNPSLQFDDNQSDHSFLKNVIYEIPLQSDSSSFKCTESCFCYLDQINLLKLFNYINKLIGSSCHVQNKTDTKTENISSCENNYNKSEINRCSEDIHYKNLDISHYSYNNDLIEQINPSGNCLTVDNSDSRSIEEIFDKSDFKNTNTIGSCDFNLPYFKENENSMKSLQNDSKLKYFNNISNVGKSRIDNNNSKTVVMKEIKDTNIEQFNQLSESHEETNNETAKSKDTFPHLLKKTVSREQIHLLVDDRNHLNKTNTIFNAICDDELLDENSVMNIEKEKSSSNLFDKERQSDSFRKCSLYDSDLQDSNDKLSLQNSCYSPEALDYEPDDLFLTPVKTLDFANEILTNDFSLNVNQTENKIIKNSEKERNSFNSENYIDLNQEKIKSEVLHSDTKTKQSPPTPVLHCVVDEDDDICEPLSPGNKDKFEEENVFETQDLNKSSSSNKLPSNVEKTLQETNDLIQPLIPNNNNNDNNNNLSQFVKDNPIADNLNTSKESYGTIENNSDKKKDLNQRYCRSYINNDKCHKHKYRYKHKFACNDDNDYENKKEKKSRKISDKDENLKLSNKYNNRHFNQSFQTFDENDIMHYVEVERWGYLTALFNEFYCDGKFANLVKYAFCKQDYDGFKFRGFMQLVTMNGKLELKKEQIYLLGAIGSGLMLEAYENNLFQTVYCIVETLHIYDINYYYLQHNINQNINIPPWSIVTPSQIALVVISSCLKLRKLSVAMQVLEDCDWAMPSVNLVPEIRRKEIIQRLNILTDLAKMWLNRNTVMTIKILKRILDSVVNDLENKQELNLVTGLKDLYNSCIEELLNIENLSSLWLIYEYYWKLESFLELKTSILRALLIICTRNNREQEVQNLFASLLSKGIYQISKPSLSAFPNSLYIMIDWTKEEIKLIMDYYLNQLCRLLFDMEDNQFTYQELFSLHIILKETTNVQDNISLKYFPIMSPEIVFDMVINIMKTLAEPLDGEKINEHLFIVRFDSFYNYFLTWQYKNFGRSFKIEFRRAVNFSPNSLVKPSSSSRNTNVLQQPEIKDIDNYINDIRCKTNTVIPGRTFTTSINSKDAKQNYFSERQKLNYSSVCDDSLTLNALTKSSSNILFNKSQESSFSNIKNIDEISDFVSNKIIEDDDKEKSKKLSKVVYKKKYESLFRLPDTLNSISKKTLNSRISPSDKDLQRKSVKSISWLSKSYNSSFQEGILNKTSTKNVSEIPQNHSLLEKDFSEELSNSSFLDKNFNQFPNKISTSSLQNKSENHLNNVTENLNKDSVSNLNLKKESWKQSSYQKYKIAIRTNTKTNNNASSNSNMEKDINISQEHVSEMVSEGKDLLHDKKDSFSDTVSCNKIYNFIKSQLLHQEKEMNSRNEDIETKSRQLMELFIKENLNESSGHKLLDKKVMKELNTFCKNYIDTKRRVP